MVLTEDTEPVEAATEAEVEPEDEQTEAGDAVEEGEEMQPEEQTEEADAVRTLRYSLENLPHMENLFKNFRQKTFEKLANMGR